MLFRYIFREIVPSALLGALLSTFVIFLQRSGPVFELLIRSSAKPKVIAYLFTLVFPPLLPMTIPFGVLVAIARHSAQADEDADQHAEGDRHGQHPHRPGPNVERWRDHR